MVPGFASNRRVGAPYLIGMGLLASSRSGSRDSFVDLDVPLWAWFALLGVIALMLGVDLFRHRDDHEPTPKEALKESLIWVAFGLTFAGVIAVAFGSKAFIE